MQKPARRGSRTLVLGDNTKATSDSLGSSWEKLDSPLVDDRNYRRSRKRQKFLDLVERFYRQIRHGCGSSTCQTSTCQTYGSSLRTSIPYRRPTPTSARAMAFMLAGKDDPCRYLCPHLPQYSNQGDLALPAATHLQTIFEDSSTSESVASRIDQWLSSSQRARDFATAHCQDLPDKATRHMEHRASSTASPINASSRSIDARHNTEEEPKLDTKSFLQMLFNTSAWKLGKIVQSRDGRYGFLPPPSPSPSTPIEDSSGGIKGVESRIRSMFLSTTGIDRQPSIEAIADRLLSDLGTSEALFNAFGTQGCPTGVVANDLPYYNVDETANHFAGLRETMKGYELIFLCLYEDSTVAYLHKPGSPMKHPLSASLPPSKAAHVVNVCFGALLSFVSGPDAKAKGKEKEKEEFDVFNYVREHGMHIPRKGHYPQEQREIANYVWHLQDPRNLRLMRRLLRIIASRSYEQTASRLSSPSSQNEFVESIIGFLESSDSVSTKSAVAPANFLLQATQAVFLHSWELSGEFCWSSDVGCSIAFMQILYDYRKRLSIASKDFLIEAIFKNLDMMEFPQEFMRYQRQPNHDHLLSYPWLFHGSNIVTYFRVINRSQMFDAVHASVTLRVLPRRLCQVPSMRQLLRETERHIHERLEIAMRDFLMLNIRRDNILDDALKELFRRQRREIRRPMKVKMGMQEGEEGVDLGGIQQEFFRLALGEALDPSYGMFTVDETTRMAWFYPGAITPNQQIFLIGLLVGLAMYNGITLSVTFPLAFYRKLLGLPVIELEHIKDGWPSLARGLKSLLDYPGDDVTDVFSRPYVFSVEAHGVTWDINMESPPPEGLWTSGLDPDPVTAGEVNSLADNAKMVSNDNREKYVSDYIYWLTDRSISWQWKSFRRGFFTCIDQKALGLFTPEALRDLVEGFQDIDITKLQKVTTYDGGYSEDHHTIQDFWSIVRAFSPAEARKLLEFVTASDRVPVKGIQEISFAIEKNGVGDERLPTTFTCFSRLLLPVYTSHAVMEVKLRQAIENSLGFGVA